MLGRKHSSVLRTIKDNLRQRAFKYGNFTERGYSESDHCHGYEFLITRRGLEVLAGVMRHSAKEKIAEAYAGAWDGAPKALLAHVASPLPEAKVEDSGVEEDGGLIHELARWIDELRSDLRKAKATAKLYADLYENEKRRRARNGEAMAHWPDLYHDLMWRLLHDTDVPLDERLAAHKEFRSRIG